MCCVNGEWSGDVISSTVIPLHDLYEERQVVVYKTAAPPNVAHIENDVHVFKATVTPPPRPDSVFHKRAVLVVSPGLICHGQAVVTLAAADAASLISSATKAAGGTLYYADGLTQMPASAKPTSSSTAGAAINTHSPILAAGGAAIAFAFAVL